jgi:hypothetical protein
LNPSEHENNQQNDLLRAYIVKRDHAKCQWPGCGSSEELEVLFITEENGTDEELPVYQNGITLCAKHKDVVMLQEKMFAPLVYDLIQLVEFEHDLVLTEKTYKDILGEQNRKPSDTPPKFPE